MRKNHRRLAIAGTALLGLMFSGSSLAWNLKEAAQPYKGVTINVVGLERPSYKAAQALTPEFEKETGIHVNWTTFPYESTLKAETLNFVSQSGQYDVVLSDVVWPVTFVDAGWVVPMKHFTDNPKLADPALDLKDFFPVWLASFTVNDKLYGLPFDSYAGLLFYNKKMLADAGFDGPPKTWDELYNYDKKLTNKDKGVYGYVLQSAHNETQTADAFARFLWPWGGRFLDIGQKKVMVDSPDSVAGIQFRRKLVKLMPSGIVSDDHPQVIQMLIQKKAAMVTEWSSFYTTLKQSPIGDDIGVAVEPKGPKKAASAFGGFAYMVSAQIPEKKQNASYLFIQWLTSKEMAKPLIEKGAVVARRSADTDPSIQADNPYLKPMVATWEHSTVPDWRPQLQCYPQFSNIVSDWGSRIEQKRLPVKSSLHDMADALQKYMDSSDCWAHANQPEKYISKYESKSAQ
ncbi:ABC transporter substrate-binding protein [Salinisphaera hydrothermalis]|uniref:Putative ABC transporter substrate-binding protein n=1 Tax=Salinisphaera hydrothermalis (strain C41B8) TaxID=1304275 RepID=A0A084IIM0_SALHC|nr:sugar ABC transporter substrate-binding protein [Salinisphaera hydrothermalis]KEZ76554.1 putative ABC transporter substrate-binding protein [Salinisphaera hydrothermalis C41B8]